MIKWQRILATEVFKTLWGISPPHILELFREPDVNVKQSTKNEKLSIMGCTYIQHLLKVQLCRPDLVK